MKSFIVLLAAFVVALVFMWILLDQALQELQ